MGFLVNSSIVGTVAWLGWKWWRKKPHGPTYTPAPKGDVMPAIAARFGVSPEVIVAANGPGFARFYAPDGSVVPFNLPKGVKDGGAREGAQGKVGS